jgi:hypothetical protein
MGAGHAFAGVTPMKLYRPYTEQFSNLKRLRIEALIDGFGEISLNIRDYKYQVFELQRCLFAGLLLAALNLSSSLLELFVRDLVIQQEFKSLHPSGIKQDIGYAEWMRQLGNIERDIEKDRSAVFPVLIKRLAGGVITNEDAREANEFYKHFRIPIQHGLIRRFVVNTADISVIENIFGRIDRFRDFEKAIEDNALEGLEFVLNFIRRYQATA